MRATVRFTSLTLVSLLAVLLAGPVLAQTPDLSDWRSSLRLGNSGPGTTQPLSLAPPAGFATPREPEQEQQQELSPECAAFAADPYADLAEVTQAGCQPTPGQMSKLMDNPLGNVAMLFTQFDIMRMESPSTGREEIYWNYMGIAQFPKSLGSKVNLINRFIWNVPSMPIDQNVIDEFTDRFQNVSPPTGVSPPPGVDPSGVLFDNRTTGFGDFYYVGLFASSTPTDVLNGKFVWGLGWDMGFPTASEKILGASKYTVGPAVIAAYMGPKWKYGFLATNYFSYAGDELADDVKMTNLQYLWYYSLSPTMSIGAAPNIILDYEQDSGNKVTLPIGIGINKTVNVGMSIRLGVEYFYNVVTPDDIVHTTWDLRIYMIPAIPSFLIPIL